MWFLNIESESWLCSTSLTLNRTYRDILVNSHILSWKQYMISSINDSMFLSSCVCVGGMLMNLCIALFTYNKCKYYIISSFSLALCFIVYFWFYQSC